MCEGRVALGREGHGLWQAPDGRPFFVMELLGHRAVHSALKNGAMPLARVLPILRQCCKALAAIHKAGLVHRDIKPKNVVLLLDEGRNDTIRVVDFRGRGDDRLDPAYVRDRALHGA